MVLIFEVEGEVSIGFDDYIFEYLVSFRLMFGTVAEITTNG